MPQLEVCTILMKDAVNILIARQKGGLDDGKWVVPSGEIKDFEHIIETCQRSMIEETGIVVKPKQTLFVSETMVPTHRVAVFCFAEYVSGDPTPGASLSEVRFVDPRSLGEYQQEGMSELTVDAFYKFSMILQQQAIASQTSGTV